MKKQEIADWVVKNVIGIDFSFDPGSKECFVIWGDAHGVGETYGRNLREAITAAMFEQAQVKNQNLMWM